LPTKEVAHRSKIGVYTAYVYYKKLLNKLENTPYHQIGTERIRVSNYTKAALLARLCILQDETSVKQKTWS
jgi:hypothetical protein